MKPPPDPPRLRPTPPPGTPLYVQADEREVDTWETASARFRLMERAGLYRLETYHMGRWEVCASGFQAVARRVAELVREESASVVNITTRKSV